MRAFVNGRCFWCQKTKFICPGCKEELSMLDAEHGLHFGLCTLCGATDDYCAEAEKPCLNLRSFE